MVYDEYRWPLMHISPVAPDIVVFRFDRLRFRCREIPYAALVFLVGFVIDTNRSATTG